MMIKNSRFVHAAFVAAIAPCFVVAGGSAQSTPMQHAMTISDQPSGLVELVRQVTEPFRDVEQAKAAEYAEFLGCVSGPQEGAMGIHYVNGRLVGDGELDVNHPEALIYEPKNGMLRLVGVEYIVLADAWHAHHPDTPVLEGQVFQFVDSPNRYGLPPFFELHVWSSRENPHGAFVDWNPRVSCEGGQ
jgi:hypothetical protein